MAKLALCRGEQVMRQYPHWPVIRDGEINAVKHILEEGKMGRVVVFGSGQHSYVDEFRETWLKYYPGKEYAIPAQSCCAALEIAVRDADLGPGDEVITPALTWPAPNIAPAMAGATPVIVDVSPDNYCIDPKAIEAAITRRTKAIIAVHIGGYACEMDKIMKIAKKHHLAVIEDCAQAQGSKYKGKWVGTWGHFGCYSFDIGKLMTSGEGGVVVYNEKDLNPWVFGVCGHAGKQINRVRDENHHRIDAWNYRMTEFQAAILLVQLTRMKEQQAKRMKNADYLRKRLSEIPGIGAVKHEPFQNYYSFIFKYDSRYFKGVPKKKFRSALVAEGLKLFSSPSDQEPVYRSPFFHVRGKDYSKMYLPVAEKAYNDEAIGIHGVNILIGEKKDMDYIVDTIIKVRENIDELAAWEGKAVSTGIFETKKKKK